MWPDRVSNPGPLTYESGALPTALHGLATFIRTGMAAGITELAKIIFELSSNIPASKDMQGVF